MNTRRAGLAGLALLACASLALAGCRTNSHLSSGTGGQATASPSPTLAAPRDAVLASTKVLTQTTYKYTLSSDGLAGTGTADPVAKKTSLSLAGDQAGVHIKMDIILIDTNLWLKMDLGPANRTVGIPTKFMRIDQNKLKDKSKIGFTPDDTDPGESLKLLKGMVDVQRVDPMHYTATIDLTQVTASSVDQDLLNKLGDKAKSVPTTIMLDDQGRLVALTLDLSAADPTATIKVTYSDFGAPVSINPPAKSNVVEAPQKVYDIFNN